MAALRGWKDKRNRMPLIPNGARQVGKTYILKEFGRSCYEECVHFNVENNNAYLAEGNLLDVAELQQNIVNEYVADMVRYAVPSTTVKIRVGGFLLARIAETPVN